MGSIKRLIILTLGTVLLLSIPLIYFTPIKYLIFSGGLVEYDKEFTFLEEVDPLDEKIEPSKPKEGKTIYSGGPYKTNQIVYKDGIGVKLEPIGWKEDAIELEGKGDYGIFKLYVYNYSSSPFSLEAEDVIIRYGETKDINYSQPLNLSGYERWKFIKDSFQFGEVSKETLRKGYIFFPVKGNGKDKGFITVYVNKVPIKFQY